MASATIRRKRRRDDSDQPAQLQWRDPEQHSRAEALRQSECRAYWTRSDWIAILCELVQHQVISELLSEINTHARQGFVQKCDIYQNLQRGDVLVTCSAGVTDNLTSDGIAALVSDGLQNKKTAQEIATSIGERVKSGLTTIARPADITVAVSIVTDL